MLSEKADVRNIGGGATSDRFSGGSNIGLRIKKELVMRGGRGRPV